jgi:hypothetical protein
MTDPRGICMLEVSVPVDGGWWVVVVIAVAVVEIEVMLVVVVVMLQSPLCVALGFALDSSLF